MASKRAQKKMIKEGVAKLKKRPGWDPAGFVKEDPAEKLRSLDQESRNEGAYAGADVCSDCLRVREESGDDTALCDRHLQEAMGF